MDELKKLRDLGVIVRFGSQPAGESPAAGRWSQVTITNDETGENARFATGLDPCPEKALAAAVLDGASWLKAPQL
jgi:hypothetical protein